MLMIRQAWRNIFRNIRRTVLTCTLIASSLVVIILVDTLLNSMTGLMVKGITELVKKIFLARPAIEAGEKLGFLPGDLSEKVNPYLQPIYDALYEIVGYERVPRLLERKIIEIAPLAYMRGRTLK